jgi:uncharacterized protein YndB with AHSA1/START domain
VIRETLVFERIYSAPPPRLFAAWTQIELLQRWFGCAPDRLWQIHEWDVHVGGRLHVSLDFDGKIFEVRGEFLIVEPPSKLSYSWFNNERVDVVIAAHGAGSIQTITHSFAPEPQAREIRTMGWSASLDHLKHLMT